MGDTHSISGLEARAKDAARSGRLAEAEKLCLEMLASAPGTLKPYMLLSELYVMTGRFEDAAELLSRPGVPLSENPLLPARLGHSLSRTGRNSAAMPFLEQAARMVPDDLRNGSRHLVKMLYAPEFSAEEFVRRAEEYCRAVRPPHVDPMPLPEAPPLRIGFVTGNLHRHPVTVFFMPVFQALNRGLVKPFVYTVRPPEPELAASVRERGDACVDLSRMTEQEAAERIRDDRLHILCDLDGHIGHNRLAIFARKPAPVQFSWIGFPGTTGMPEMDFLMLGADECGPDADTLHSEKLVRMDHGFAPFTLIGRMPEVNELPSLSGAPFTFASFNYLPKHTPETYGLWAEILERVPGSRLFLKTPSLSDERVRNRCLEELHACGIDASRVLLGGGTTRYEHLKACNKVDVGLDPLAYSGSTTTCEMLSMGVPVITLPGQGYHQRHSLSFLNAAGLSDWAVDSEEAYVRKAVEVAGNAPALSELRRGLQARLAASPVCDAAGFTRRFEHALYDMAGVPKPEAVPEAVPKSSGSKQYPPPPHPDSPHSALALALTLRGAEAANEGNDAAAEGCCLQALAHDPDWLPARLNLVRVLVKAGRMEEAREWFEPMREAELDTGRWPGIDEVTEEVRRVLDGR